MIRRPAETASRAVKANASINGHGRRLGLVDRLVAEIPDRLPVVVACLAFPALLATLCGQFRPVVVLPAWVVLVVLTWSLVPAPPKGRRAWRPVVALLALVGGWTAWNVARSSQYVVVNRDPGFLTLKAWWLVGHASARIPVGAALPAAVAGAREQVDGAFTLHGDVLLAQGNSTVPAVLATVGWAGGPPAVLWANVLVGAVALVAVYAVTRRLMGPWWALLAPTCLGLTMPMQAFSRSAYTEPLVLALTFGGVALLLGARGAPRRSSLGTFALGGAVVGMAAAARIDGAIAVIGVAAGLACLVLATGGRAERRRAARHVAAAMVAMVAVAALGLVDLATLSPSYFHDLRSQLHLLLGATAAVIVVVALVLATPLRNGVPLWAARHRRGLAATVQGLAVAAFLVLVTRPWWWTTHGNAQGSGVANVVAVLQKLEGLPVDGTRTYGEQTVTWLAWYVGWPAVLAAAVGAVLLVRRAVTRRDGVSAAVACVIAAGSGLYLVVPSITPDQIWAMRRFLPVALPGLLLLAAVTVAAAWRRGAVKGGWRWRVPAVLLAAALVAAPVSMRTPVADDRQFAGQLPLIEGTCAGLSRAGADHVVWVDSYAFPYLATLRIVCDVQVVDFGREPTRTDLAQVAAAWHGERVVVLAGDPALLGLPGNAQPLVPRAASSFWAWHLSGPPASNWTYQMGMWGGTLNADGKVTPLPGSVLTAG